jgi:hypothetical protein
MLGQRLHGRTRLGTPAPIEEDSSLEIKKVWKAG